MGEHVDYAGGVVVALAVDRGVTVRLHDSNDGEWRVESAGRTAARRDPVPAGDIGDRIFGAGEALRRRGIPVAPFSAHVSSTLPESAGLASSAALICATLVALLRRLGRTMAAVELVQAALTAERDVAGVPVGDLDPTVIVQAGGGGVLVMDFKNSGVRRLRWPWPGVGLVLCASGERHDVGGAGYRLRREECAAALRQLQVAGAQEIEERSLGSLPEPLQRRARHLAGETARSRAAEQALLQADAPGLGRLMDASHASLAADYEVSTARLDELAAAARSAGALGARLVGAGFGGSVVALCETERAGAVGAAMLRAGGVQAWPLHPGPGLVESAADAIQEAPVHSAAQCSAGPPGSPPSPPATP